MSDHKLSVAITNLKGSAFVTFLVALAFAVLISLGFYASASAHQKPANSYRATAEQVELTADDITEHTCEDPDGDTVTFYAIDHNLGDAYGPADDIVYREPARLGGQNFHFGPQTVAWNTLYLGVGGPDCTEIQHKGQVSVYYDYDHDYHSIVAQFDGQGELLSVNGVDVE